MSEWKCQACGKYLPIDHSAIKEGDKVTFTTTIINNRSVRCSTKDGLVLQSGKTFLLVQPTRCRKPVDPVRIHRNGAHPIGAPSSLSYQLFGTCECKKDGAA